MAGRVGKYGDYPEHIGIIPIDVKEMMFYQYLPIKQAKHASQRVEKRLDVFNYLIELSIRDFIINYGVSEWYSSYIYLTVKNLYQEPGKPFNREGWHSDGFMTDDINYIWSNNTPTIFSHAEFNLTQNHEEAIKEMQIQAQDCGFNNRSLENQLLRLNQFNIHKCGEVLEPGVRCFFKLSFSRDKYNLIGNSHNYELDYNWQMHPRENKRNHPSK